MRVLIVDDEPSVRRALQLALDDGKREVEAVDSGEAALAKLEAAQFDLVLVDKNMPGMSGVDLMRAIRKTNPNIGLIMLTGYPSADSAVEALHLGVDGYIEKPFTNVFDVVKRVEDVVNGRAKGKPYDNAISHFRKAREMLKGGGVKEEKSHALTVLVFAAKEEEQKLIATELAARASVVPVTSLDDLATAARDKTPGLVISDLGPTFDLAVRRLREIAPSVPVMVMIDKAPSVQRISELIELGVVSMLNKPFDAATLRAKLEAVAPTEKG
jgi:DNA-binding response OmpR family regulator